MTQDRGDPRWGIYVYFSLIYFVLTICVSHLAMIDARFPEGSSGRAKFEEFKSNFFHTMMEVSRPDPRLATFCHGDTWINNFLFKYEKVTKRINALMHCFGQFYSHAYLNTREIWTTRKPTLCILNGRWLEHTNTNLHFKWGSVWIVTSFCFLLILLWWSFWLIAQLVRVCNRLYQYSFCLRTRACLKLPSWSISNSLGTLLQWPIWLTYCGAQPLKPCETNTTNNFSRIITASYAVS